MPRATRAVEDAARRIVRIRDGHRCQLCGQSVLNIPSAIHHRRRKGMGGSALLESPSNLIRVCGSGNTDGCHGRVHGNPEWAHQAGWLLWETDDPQDTPILTIHGWVYLLRDGDRVPSEAIEEFA